MSCFDPRPCEGATTTVERMCTAERVSIRAPVRGRPARPIDGSSETDEFRSAPL